MEFLSEIGLFGLKALVIVISIIVVLLFGVMLAAKNKLLGKLEVKDLNDQYQGYSNLLKQIAFSKDELKKDEKSQKKKDKKSKKAIPSKIYYIKFEGDIKASSVEQLREEVTTILSVASKKDEVVVNIESPGGMVHTYGLAAAQLERIKKAEIPLTVCVDKVAASGGYLMACTANKILAAPFAIVGSIGVIAQVPNFNKLLKKNNIDYEEITSGEYKRTVSLFGEITEKGKQKFTEDIVETHKLFRDFVNKHRPHLDINQVATGEHWYGQQAIDKKLIDEIATSDEYLYSKINDFRIISVKVKEKQGLQKKLSEAMSLVVKKGISGYLKEVETDYKF